MYDWYRRDCVKGLERASPPKTPRHLTSSDSSQPQHHRKAGIYHTAGRKSALSGPAGRSRPGSSSVQPVDSSTSFLGHEESLGLTKARLTSSPRLQIEFGRLVRVTDSVRPGHCTVTLHHFWSDSAGLLSHRNPARSGSVGAILGQTLSNLVKVCHILLHFLGHTVRFSQTLLNSVGLNQTRSILLCPGLTPTFARTHHGSLRLRPRAPNPTHTRPDSDPHSPRLRPGPVPTPMRVTSRDGQP